MSILLHYAIPQTQDRRIFDDVCRQLTWQSDIQSEEIAVTVKNSKVFLTGRVQTCFEKAEAERAANAVYGVTDIVNDIAVEPKQARTDSQVAADITAALRTCTSVIEELPEVNVTDGVAILQGSSRWEFQRHGAEQQTLAIVGVRSVVNLIVVDPASRTVHDRKKPANLYRPLTLVSMRAS